MYKKAYHAGREIVSMITGDQTVMQLKPNSATIRRMFANEETGFWFDSTEDTSSPSISFITNSKTAGDIKIVDHDFSIKSYTGWSVIGTGGTLTRDPSGVILSGGVYSGIRKGNILELNSLYVIRVDAKRLSGTHNLVATAGSPTIISDNEPALQLLTVPNSTNLDISINTNLGDGTRWLIRDIKVNKLPPNSAIQTTASKRPMKTIDGIVFDKVDDSLNVAFDSELTNCTIIKTTSSGTKILTKQNVSQNYIINEDFHQMLLIDRDLTYEELVAVVRVFEKKAGVTTPMTEDEIFATAMFKSNDVGFWFDSSDLNTALSVTLNPTTNPILLLDKSLNLEKSENLLDNPTFNDNYSGWVKSAQATVSVNNDEITVGNPNSALDAQVSQLLNINAAERKTYIIGVDVVHEVGVGIMLIDGHARSIRSVNLANTSSFFTADATQITHTLRLRATQENAVVRFKNPYVRWIKGRHATQENTAKIPTVTDDGVIFDKVDTALNVYFDSALSNCTVIRTTKSGTVVQTGQSVAQDYVINKNFHQMMVINRELSDSELNIVIKHFEKKAKTIKPASEDYFIKSLFSDGSQGLYYNASLQSHSIQLTDFSGNDNHGIQPTSASRASYGINGGLKFFNFDGIDDGYVTQSVDFTHTDEVTVIAAVRKLSDTATAIVCELSTVAESSLGAFALFAPSLKGQKKFNFRSLGTTGLVTGTTGALNEYPAPVSAVLCAEGKISDDLCRLTINRKTTTTSVEDQGDGNYRKYPIYIGRRAGTTLPLNGYIYALFVIDRLLTPQEIEKIENHFAQLSGVVLA